MHLPSCHLDQGRATSGRATSRQSVCPPHGSERNVQRVDASGARSSGATRRARPGSCMPAANTHLWQMRVLKNCWVGSPWPPPWPPCAACMIGGPPPPIAIGGAAMTGIAPLIMRLLRSCGFQEQHTRLVCHNPPLSVSTQLHLRSGPGGHLHWLPAETPRGPRTHHATESGHVYNHREATAGLHALGPDDNWCACLGAHTTRAAHAEGSRALRKHGEAGWALWCSSRRLSRVLLSMRGVQGYKIQKWNRKAYTVT